MNRNKLRTFKPGTADYVIAHAEWRASRGRRPSMTYMHERNPMRALSLAKAYQGINIIEDSTPPKPECERPRSGLRVIITELGAINGIRVRADYLDPINRKEGIVGRLLSMVPGHGGDVWFVEHEDDAQRIGAFVIDEFKRHPVQRPSRKVFVKAA